MTSEIEILSNHIQTLTWAMGLGFAALGSITLYLHSKTCQRIDKLDGKLTDIDRRLCRIEGAMSNKDCCMLKHTHDQVAK